MLSDHNVIQCTLTMKHHLPETRSIQYRKIKKIDHVKFGNLVQDTLDTHNINTLEQKVDHYNKTLTECLQECAPFKTKQLKTSKNIHKTTMVWWQYKTLNSDQENEGMLM